MTTPVPQSIEVLRLIIDNGLMITGTLFSALFMLIVAVLMFNSVRKVDLTQLWRSEGTGLVSSTKFWSNIAYFVATVAFLAINFVAPGVAAVEWIWMIYLGVVGGSAVISKFIAARSGVGSLAQPAKEQPGG